MRYLTEPKNAYFHGMPAEYITRTQSDLAFHIASVVRPERTVSAGVRVCRIVYRIVCRAMWLSSSACLLPCAKKQ